jgi:hypothetical protein
MCRRLIVLMLCLTLASFGFVALAQKGEPPKCDPAKEKCGCSPGFYKNHLDFWQGQSCGGSISDETLLEALTCRGSDASCGRSAAAAILDACTGCVETD